jgi:hypothetical protein
MCTLSIIFARDNVLRVAMNRDELDSRPPALPPRVVQCGTTRAIMPIDPQSRGTWIAVNDFGVVLAVLNRNASSRSPGTPTSPSPGTPKEGPGEGLSRGTIIPKLLQADCAHDALTRARELSLHRYNPFRLILADRGSVASMTCDGSRPVIEDHPYQPLLFTSSGLGDHFVEQPRRALFDQLMFAIDFPRAAQDTFHYHRFTDRPHLSVNMIRPGARTVSRTVIEVGDKQVVMSYEPNGGGETSAVCLNLACREVVPA